MEKKAAKKFREATAHGTDAILAAIRAPEEHFLTGCYVNNRSAEVANALLQLAGTGEAAVVVSFIVSDAVRFETLTENAQLGTLMDMLGKLDKAEQTKILAATEATQYGTPNATVLQNIVSSKDKTVIEKLGAILRGLDNPQRIEIFSAPRAMWWTSSYEQIPLMVEILSPLSQGERQKIVDNDPDDIAETLEVSWDAELSNLFADCKFTPEEASLKPPAPGKP